MEDYDQDNSDNAAKNSLNNLTKIFKKNEPTKTNFLSDLNYILKQNEQNGNITTLQLKMIENVLKFQFVTAGDIMTHRVDILAIENTSTIADALKISLENGLSRIPVFKQNIDSIIGAIFVKDLLKIVNEPNFSFKPINSLIRELIYVPKTIKCINLFLKLTKSHNHLAVVVDDFGGTSGLVTMEDIIETIFGQIQDEYDNETEDIKKINNHTYIIQGYTNLNEVFKILNLDISSNSRYETLSGFLIELLGRIPEKTEQPTLTYKNVDFEILKIEKHHISKVKAVKLN